ncbi:hypothetical protein IMAU60212_01513 [Lactobacillus helveticus]|nr:hypothetical protein [Lactobacillus helveticus]NRO21047.1 hypothetical protein [Lactobacillus helveticus]NRO41360.1 hypothetical protein [Lactobacillus helveticus]NRO46569.1 hypothetical protein [Lactobacillus helveticus]NRO60842.1 hypothetical protein [Lactobacillus helveticus]
MKKWLKALAGGLVTTSAATMLAAYSNSKADSRDYEKSLTWMTTSEVQTLDQWLILLVVNKQLMYLKD